MGVQLQSQALQAGTDNLSDFAGVFANAGREHQGVNATHCHRQGTDRLSNSASVDPQRQLGLLVTGPRRGQHLTHVARDARHPQQARFLVKRPLDLCGCQPVALLNVISDITEFFSEPVPLKAARAAL